MSKDEGGNVTSYTYDDGDRMLTAGGVGYAYDNNGNQTGRGADTFGWDYENRLISATVNGTSVSYTYRGDGLRHSKTVGSNTISLRAEALEAEAYTWDVNRGLPVVLQDGAYTYVYGLGLISQTDNSGNQSYFLGNGLGSTEALVDGSGNVIATYKYDVYGAVRSSSGSGSTEYRFTGQQDDADIGYTYLRARYYDQATGRFLSKDPWRGRVSLPATQHHYAYSANDPVNWRDPRGLDYVDVNITVGAGLGVTFGLMFSNEKGTYVYAGAGFTTPGPSASVTFSGSDPATGWNVAVQLASVGAGQAGWTFAPNGGLFGEWGAGTPGGSLTVFYSAPWEDFQSMMIGLGVIDPFPYIMSQGVCRRNR